MKYIYTFFFLFIFQMGFCSMPAADSTKNVSYLVSFSGLFSGQGRYFFSEPGFGMVYKKQTFIIAPLYYSLSHNEYRYGLHLSYEYCRKPGRKIVNLYWGADFIFVVKRQEYSDNFSPIYQSTLSSNDKFYDFSISYGIRLKLTKMKNKYLKNIYFFETASLVWYMEDFLLNETYKGNIAPAYWEANSNKSLYNIDGVIKVGIGYSFIK
jgi:hypothetical protein